MIVDGLLVSVGSTNFDNRSFHLKDEATLNLLDAKLQNVVGAAPHRTPIDLLAT